MSNAEDTAGVISTKALGFLTCNGRVGVMRTRLSYKPFEDYKKIMY
jgi:hypothetical protein